MTESVTYHWDLVQGTDEWLEARLGVLTASEMKHLFTKKLAPSKAETAKTHMYKLASERINRVIEDNYVSHDMERGKFEEMEACMVYIDKVAPLKGCGFITNDKWGFKLGFSPDGLVGDDGMIEAKSRAAKFQVRTIFDSVINGNKAPDEFMLQMQTGMMVAEREWCDFLSYSNGMPMAVVRVEPDPDLQSMIIDVASEFEANMKTLMQKYGQALVSDARLFPTERKDFNQDMVV